MALFGKKNFTIGKNFENMVPLLCVSESLAKPLVMAKTEHGAAL